MTRPMFASKTNHQSSKSHLALIIIPCRVNIVNRQPSDAPVPQHLHSLAFCVSISLTLCTAKYLPASQLSIFPFVSLSPTIFLPVWCEDSISQIFFSSLLWHVRWCDVAVCETMSKARRRNGNFCFREGWKQFGSRRRGNEASIFTPSKENLHKTALLSLDEANLPRNVCLRPFALRATIILLI